jgi:histidinol dehydrogenase
VKIIESTNEQALSRLFRNRQRGDRALEKRVNAIVEAVRREGDRALKRLSRKFDGGELREISVAEMKRAAARLSPEIRAALGRAARNLRVVAARQLPKSHQTRVAPGLSIAQQVEPLARVGCYIPAGRYPLASTVLMAAVPASVAGVREIIVVCPRPDAVVLAAALAAGVTGVFVVGGAHAIAALAYGTNTIPRVEKIVGPGNRYVTAAKKLVAADCAIDFCAGPTEIVICAAETDPAWVAADLVAQAEHDPDARVALLTWRRRFADRVAACVAEQAGGNRIAQRALRNNGRIVLTKSPNEAVRLAGRFAPEHLVLENESMLDQRPVAGTIFIGGYAVPAAGDYVTGSNHILPTNGMARVRGGLSVADFVRVFSVQRMTRRGMSALAPAATTLARAEGLGAHAASIEVRLNRMGG